MKHEINPKKNRHWKNVNPEHFKTVKTAAVAQILFQTSSMFPHSESPPQGPSRPHQLGKHFLGICLLFAWQRSPVCVVGRWLPEQRVFSDKPHSKLFWTSFLDASEAFCCQHTPYRNSYRRNVLLRSLIIHCSVVRQTCLKNLPSRRFLLRKSWSRKTTKFYWFPPKGKKRSFSLFVLRYDEHGWSFPLYLSCHMGFMCCFIVL